MNESPVGGARGVADEVAPRKFTDADWRPIPRHTVRAVSTAIAFVILGGSALVWGYDELLHGAATTTAKEVPTAAPPATLTVTGPDNPFKDVFAAPTAPAPPTAPTAPTAPMAPDRETIETFVEPEGDPVTPSPTQVVTPVPERAIDDVVEDSDDPLDRIEPNIAGPTLPDFLQEPPAESVEVESGSVAQPIWLANAVPVLRIGDRPMIAIVIDDMGLDRRRSQRAVGLPGPLTLAFLAYADDLRRQTAAARAEGHELLVHVPMEPLHNAEEPVNPGPKALLVDHTRAEILDRLRWDLDRFDGYVGVNNHMGSRFTSDRRGMTIVLQELKARGLLFLDSKTSANSVGGVVAAQVGMPHIQRDVFLDNQSDPAAIAAALAAVEQRARAKGFAVAIGHPREETLNVLEAWLPTAADKGFALVPISAIMRHISPAG